MNYSYVARQPILDRDRKTIGYELLFRDGPNNCFPEIDSNLATSRLLSDHFLSTHYSTLGEHLGFVNFPYQSLINRVPSLFPVDNLVVEVLEDCLPTDELLEAIKDMARQGYKIALDDFVPSKEWKAFLPYISIIKFDIRALPIAKTRVFIEKIKDTKIRFLAEKVETHEEFEQAKEAGYHYFQGYFFSKPEIIQRKALEPSFVTLIQLCKEVAKDDINYASIEDLVSSDLTLSYKLLTFVNASSTVSSKITSFRQALVYLGKERLRKFISLVAIASTKESKPQYLYGLSVQRARFCELLFTHHTSEVAEGSAFLTGMFSLLDSLLDQPLEELVEAMPIEEEVKEALCHGSGVLGQILLLVKAYEKADWSKVAEMTEELGLESDKVNLSYDESLKWTADLFSAS
ncbi:EAL and HDOD domain-containing protein [Vibrio genomosp. F10]|uniref:EAL and HDOD domain-containing protein n=1 Tax=Vibrio genomosp. F10 TaxID=723171 RepID=UPI0002D8E0CF|nr:EAL and HDOD domain-containing protein [Vibrio genomosp. F10]OEE81867.1 histidine kinase [Vibrio genomosp. F10 str. 9ZD137]